MGDIRETTTVVDGNLAVRATEVTGTRLPPANVSDRLKYITTIVQTDEGDKELCVKVTGLGGGGGGGGTTNYNELSNRPKINSVTLSGNKTSAQLGLQPTIDSTHKLSVDNVQGAAKETTIETLTTTSVELASNTIYNGGELASVTLTLPSSIPADFICQVEFTSGTTPTTFTAPATLYFNGDACDSGVFTPVASKRYCILIITDGVNPLGFVYEK